MGPLSVLNLATECAARPAFGFPFQGLQESSTA